MAVNFQGQGSSDTRHNEFETFGVQELYTAFGAETECINSLQLREERS